jgi:hypothetical protein
MPKTDTPYYYHVQTDFEAFWASRTCGQRKILFIFGLGFDPRCVPAFRTAARVLAGSARLDTLCLRFKNPQDSNLGENTEGTYECLREIDQISASLCGSSCRHDQLEVNLFDTAGTYDGHKRLLSDFTTEYKASLGDYTDIIVDISAFPRSLMYALLTELHTPLKARQNLFAVLSEVPIPVSIEEEGYSEPHFIISPSGRSGTARVTKAIIWIPVLGGSIDRLDRIYKFLGPKETFPIVPFPTRDPRAGDLIVLRSRRLFDKWGVPFSNVMYACGDVPFDIYRKITDIVERYRSFMNTDEMVVSALSGRSLSLGVLLAAWRHRLPVCQIQPKTYRLASPARADLRMAALSAKVTLYWLSGEIYL